MDKIMEEQKIKTEAEIKKEFLEEHMKLVEKYGYDFFWQVQQPIIAKVSDVVKQEQERNDIA